MGSSTSCHLTAIYNTTCITRALPGYCSNRSSLGVGTRTSTIKLHLIENDCSLIRVKY